jgi:hypothetical protein
MKNSDISWIEWQKLIIREEYKDLNNIIPARDNVQRQFDKTVKDTKHLLIEEKA